MPKSTVYVVVFAEPFSHVTEGIFSTPEKAEIFRQKLIAETTLKRQGLETLTESNFEELYEVREWVVDELEDAFLQYSAIARPPRPDGTREISALSSDFVAEVEPNEYVRYTDGTVAEIAYGRSLAEAVAKLQAESQIEAAKA